MEDFRGFSIGSTRQTPRSGFVARIRGGGAVTSQGTCFLPGGRGGVRALLALGPRGCFSFPEKQDVHTFLLGNLRNGGILELMMRYLKVISQRFLVRWPPGLSKVVLSIYHSWRKHSSSLPNPLLRDCSNQHIRVRLGRPLLGTARRQRGFGAPGRRPQRPPSVQLALRNAPPGCGHWGRPPVRRGGAGAQG